QHPRRPLVRLQHAHRLARLDQQRLVVGQRLQRPHDRVVRRPVARRLARAAVDHELLGVLGNLGVEVVLQHPQRGFLRPIPAGQLSTARRANGRLHASSPVMDSAAAFAPPDFTKAVAASISGARKRSGPGPGSAAATAAVAWAGMIGARSAAPRAAVISSIASTCASPSIAVRSLRPADQPIDTWSSCIADDGIESTEAGTARRFISETSPACVYWAIIRP